MRGGPEAPIPVSSPQRPADPESKVQASTAGCGAGLQRCEVQRLTCNRLNYLQCVSHLKVFATVATVEILDQAIGNS